MERENVVFVGNGARTRHAGNGFDSSSRRHRLAGLWNKEFRGHWLPQFHIEHLPVAEGQLTRGKFPDDQLLAREPIATAGEFARENLARSKSAIAVAQDAIDRPSAEREAQ